MTPAKKLRALRKRITSEEFEPREALDYAEHQIELIAIELEKKPDKRQPSPPVPDARALAAELETVKFELKAARAELAIADEQIERLKRAALSAPAPPESPELEVLKEAGARYTDTLIAAQPTLAHGMPYTGLEDSCRNALHCLAVWVLAEREAKGGRT